MLHPKRLHVVRSVRNQSKKQAKSPFLPLCLFFLIGALLGSAFAVLGGSHPQLAERLTAFFQSAVQNGAPSVSLWATVWEAICWPLLLILFSFGPPGVIGIPCVFLVRGFLLSYACSSFVAMFGLTGLGWNVVIFGISALFLLPVLLCVGHWAFSNACKQCFPQEASPSHLPSSPILVYCGILLVLFIFLQSQVLPVWLPKLCEKLLSMH